LSDLWVLRAGVAIHFALRPASRESDLIWDIVRNEVDLRDLLAVQ
jgi:hypothetical protein